MMDIWWHIAGAVRLRLTGADPERTLRMMAKELRLENIDKCSDLVFQFTLARQGYGKAAEIAQRNGDKLEIIRRYGLPEALKAWAKMPVIALTVLALIGATAWIPSRIFFIQVEGNGTVPTRKILQEAENCGLGFGTSRGALRSEQIKNRLLKAMPELKWVGVNTAGCVATITVQERELEPERKPDLPGNIVAVTDAVVTELTATAGTPLCAVGDGVKAGQVLISGYTDLGLRVQVEAAQGEVYGLTHRENTAVITSQTLVPGEKRETKKKYSLLIGKKRINFGSDSGILYAGCGKMTQIEVLRLPGGWELPIALVVETYTVAELHDSLRWEQGAYDLLEQASRAQVLRIMTAGEIRQTESWTESADGLYRLDARYECREMIGRRGIGIQTEGDTDYGRENGERGAG